MIIKLEDTCSEDARVNGVRVIPNQVPGLGQKGAALVHQHRRENE